MKLSDVKKACAICCRLKEDEYIMPSNESKLRIFMANNKFVHNKWSVFLEQNMPKFKTESKLYLCSLHFTDEDFKKSDGKLKPDAMPKVKIGLKTFRDCKIPGPNITRAEQQIITLSSSPDEDQEEEEVLNIVAPVLNGGYTIPVDIAAYTIPVVTEEFTLPVANGDFYTNPVTDLNGVDDLMATLEDPLQEQPTKSDEEPEQIIEKCVICANFENFDVNNSEKQVTYFNFPARKTEQLAWKEAITRHKPGLDFDAAKAWVCSLHFPENVALNGTKHGTAPQVVFQPQYVKPPPVKCPRPKRTGPECVICLGLQHYYPASNDGDTNDRPRVFVNFPSNKTMRTLWTKIILTKFPATKIMTPQICSRHFLDTDFDATGELVWHATPVIPILPPAPDEPEIEDEDVSDWMPPDLIEFETVQLMPENADICSLNAGVDAKEEGLATCTFLFTKPSVLVRVSSESAIKAGQKDLQIMNEFQKFVSQAELEYMTRLNEFYIEGVPPDEDNTVQCSNCRLCLNHKDLISINEQIQSKESTKTIAEWLMLFCPGVRITPIDQLSQEVCMDCKIEVLYAINLRVRAVDSNQVLKKMLQDCDSSIEMMPMCRICMDDTDLQSIEALKADIKVITDFDISLDNGLPNYICKVDAGKIKATIVFLEKVKAVEEVQKGVMLSGQDVGTFFPALPSPQVKSEKEEDDEPIEETDDVIEISDSEEEAEAEPPEQPPEFPCNKCKNRFQSVEALNEHRRTAHYVAVPKQCDICAEILPDAYKFRLHTLQEHYEGNDHEIYECSLCQRTFKHQLLLEDHFKKCQMSQAINQKKPLKVWSCQYCRFKTFLETLYREHLLIHGDKYQCHHCKKYFAPKSRLLQHFTSLKSTCNRKRRWDAYSRLQRRSVNFNFVGKV